MSLKTVLVHLETEAAAVSVAKTALNLAKSFSAHLIGLHVVPDAFISAAVPPEVVGELLEAQREANRAAGKRVADSFAQVIAGQDVSSEWRLIEAHFEPVATVAMRHGREADLVVLAQPDQSINLIDGIGATEEVMLGLGRPALIVPSQSQLQTVGKRILLAWNGSRESARAVFDSLPMLKKAENVRILTAGPDKGGLWAGTDGDPAPAAGIAAALARHGVKCEIARAAAPSSDVAHDLLSETQSAGCDLLVMGGYGHWRLREIVFGGATKGVLKNAKVPVLMSH
jgi:nucleotide-binding universal stress UspA family protein